jgi:hypothetical protein
MKAHILIAALAATLPLASLATVPSDLTLDTRFGDGGSGIVTLDGTDTSLGLDDEVIKILPKSNTFDTGYWVIASQTNAGSNGTWKLLDIDNHGNFASTDSDADPFISVPVDALIADVGSERHVYLIGPSPVGSDENWGIKCLNVSGGSFHGYCNAFGMQGADTTDGEVTIDFAQGSSHNDIARRVAYYNGYLYVTGIVDVGTSVSDYAVGVAKIDATTGALDANWGDQAPKNGKFIYNINYQANGFDIPNAIVVGMANPLQIGGVDTRVDIFVAGYSSVSSIDNDGWVMAIDDNDSANGSFDHSWNTGHLNRLFFDLGSSHKQDSITAMTQRGNGDLLIAGYAVSDSSTEMVIGEIRPSGSLLSSFCGAGACHSSYLSNSQVPAAIVERPGAGDFVVASNQTLDFFGDGQPVVGLYQFSANGNAVRANDYLDMDADPTYTNSTRANTLLLDPKNHDVVLGGWYRHTPPVNGYDNAGVISWYRATDSIFANGFGGVYHD